MGDMTQDNLSNASPWPSPDKANDMMEFVLDYYVRHHQVVFQKLHKAQEATIKSMEELEELSLEAKSPHADNLKVARQYDKMWDHIITLFKAHGATEEDLERIENVLQKIPRIIKRHYDVLITQDEELQRLIASLKTDEYKKTCALIEKVQSLPNPMTGIVMDEYVSTPVTEVLVPHSYQINPHILENDD